MLQIIRFLVSGGTNFVLTLLVFWALIDWVLIPYPIASILTWVLGITVNLGFMWFWVFPGEALQGFVRTYQRHFMFHLCYYLLNLALLILFTETTGAHPLVVQLVLLVFLLPLNFLGMKYLVIGSQEPLVAWLTRVVRMQPERALPKSSLKETPK